MLLLGGAMAGADEPPLMLTIARVDPAVCFDAPALVAALRREMPALVVATAGAAPLVVTVEAGPLALDVLLVRAAADPGAVALREHRSVPLGAPCQTLVEAVSAILVRVAAPLELAAPPPPARPLPPPVSPPAAAPSPRALHLELGIALRVGLATDGTQLSPGGRLHVGARFRRFVAIVAAGVEQDSTGSDATGSVAMRHIPCVAAMGYEHPIPTGGLRFLGGAAFDVWTAEARGPRYLDRIRSVEPGLHAEAAYRLSLGVFAAFIGLDLDWLPVRQAFVAPGTGFARDTPALWLSPRVGAAVTFF